jgi:epoxyqueuosine reductase
MTRLELNNAIRQEALNLGFTACGIARAGRLDEDSDHLKEWLSQGMHAGMQYMENYFEKRIDTTQLLPGAKSVISVILNYFTPIEPTDKKNPVISKYAYGHDYHDIIKKKLKNLQLFILNQDSEAKIRISVDTAPVLERAWAELAGVGWIGKNANLISPRFGSFVFIGEIITSLELVYDSPINDFCGSCTKCIQACPTGAIVSAKKIDSNLCISYWTIENKGSMPYNLKDKFNNRIFGCDICQDVCPWNRKAESHSVPEFQPSHNLISMTKNDWQNLTEEKYRELFGKSAVKRSKFSGLRRNIDFVNISEQ